MTKVTSVSPKIIKYEGPDSKNPFAFKYYDPEKVILGKKMKEHLPFAMAWWHNLGANGVDKDFKMNIEANHATLAGHTFQHELRISRINDMLGSIDANQGDVMLGWDTDCFPSNVYDTTLAMYEIVKNGGLPVGINFDSKNRRPSNTYEDMFHAFILGMDSFAFGLIKAAEIIEDGRLEGFVDKKYESFSTELGQKIRKGETTIEELAARAAELKAPKNPISGQQEYLEGVLNNIVLSGIK